MTKAVSAHTVYCLHSGVTFQLMRLLQTTNESYSPPPVGGVVRSISIVPPEICAGVVGGVDVIEEDVVEYVVEDAVEDAVDDAVDDMIEDAVDDVGDVEEVVVDVEEVMVDVEDVVVDVEEVVEVVEGNVADAVDDEISEEEDDVGVVFVDVIVACVDAGATHVLVDDDVA